MLNKLNGLAGLLVPELTIMNKDCLGAWKVKERVLFSWYLKRSFSILGVIYFIHPLIVEIPIKASNLSNFIIARWSVAGLLFILAFLERLNLLKSPKYILYFTVFIMFPCYLQGLCLTWDSRCPWIFSLIVPLLFSSVLFSNLFTKYIQFILGTLVQLPFLLPILKGNDIPTFISFWLFGFVVLTLFGLIYARDVEKFQAEQLSKRSFKIASQVAHDIRSPIAALKVIFKNSSGLSDDEKMIAELALQRIDGIAQDVLGEHRIFQKGNDRGSYSLILPVLESIFKEKQIEYRGQVNLSLLNQGILTNQMVQFEERGLRRVLSNLVNNSAEAMDYKGDIELRIQDSPSVVLISVRDKGKGISPELLERIREGSFVSGKPHGNGLGLSDATEQLQLWGGQLTVESQLNRGTVVVLALKKGL